MRFEAVKNKNLNNFVSLNTKSWVMICSSRLTGDKYMYCWVTKCPFEACRININIQIGSETNAKAGFGKRKKKSIQIHKTAKSNKKHTTCSGSHYYKPIE